LNEKIFDMEVKLLDWSIAAGGALYELMRKSMEQMKDMKYMLEQDGDVLEDRGDKVLEYGYLVVEWNGDTKSA
jgi:hypothetical protein